MPRSKVPISFRVAPETKTALEGLADSAGLSKTAWLEGVVADRYMPAHGTPAKGSTPSESRSSDSPASSVAPKSEPAELAAEQAIGTRPAAEVRGDWIARRAAVLRPVHGPKALEIATKEWNAS